jgi:hypothetical protein
MATSSTAAGQEREKRHELSYAWDALSQPYIDDPEYKRAVNQSLLTAAAMRRNNIVTLGPRDVILMHAMADAVGVPYSPQQTAIDLLASPARKDLFRKVYFRISQQIGI